MTNIPHQIESGGLVIDGQHRLLAQAWDCAFAELPVAYLSGPITGGPRFIQWYDTRGQLIKDKKNYKAEHHANVVQPNERDLRDTARQLRLRLGQTIVEPASLQVTDWSQHDYMTLWEEFIEKHAARVIMMPGWEYSSGCAAEFAHACEHGIPVYSVVDQPIATLQGLRLLREALDVIGRLGLSTASIERSKAKVDACHRRATQKITAALEGSVRKDASLDRLAETINVAQFVSFEPSGRPKQAFSRVLGLPPNHRFSDARSAIERLLVTSADKSVNVRSFTPDSPLSREFIYGLSSAEDAFAAVQRLNAEGLYIIVNETINVNDGGVSGVLMGGIIEFAPDDTPRCVEKPGVASLPREWGTDLLSTVYRFTPDFNVPFAGRLEFSLHPQPRGWRSSHTLGWEYAPFDPPDIAPRLDWPNRFSRLIGDKVFGLLVAHHIGLPVPLTTVLSCRIAPFNFGRATGLAETWLRTSPAEQVPGKFTTVRGWLDPFHLLAQEDPGENMIASVVSQAAVRSEYSGAAIVSGDSELIIEGRQGEGEVLMRGEAQPEVLPPHIVKDVQHIYDRARVFLGPIRFEWVHDGREVWIVQLHRGATQSTRKMLVPGLAEHWKTFDVGEGLERLREAVAAIKPGEGLLLSGGVGLTSHIADIIRRAKVPALVAD